jgi:uncharacterized membrane protein
VTSRGASRQASIDVLRATAIVLMVVVHFVENLSGWFAGDAEPFVGVHRVWWLPTGWAAPMFAFLSGVSYRIWLGVQISRGRDPEAISRRTVRRGLFLIGLGFAFNVLLWLPEDVFNWDILTLVGGALLTLEIARRMPDAVILLAAALVIAVAPAMREAAGYHDYWAAGYYDYDFTLADVALGWLVTGYFPVFPWLAFPLAGYGLAPRLGYGDDPWPANRRTLGVAAVLVVLAAVLVCGWSIVPASIRGDTALAWTMFPASTAYVLGTLGGTTLALAALHSLLDGPALAGLQHDCAWPCWPGVVSWATPLSRHALSIYLIHHAVHVWPLWAWSLATTGEATALWQVAMPPWASLILAAAFLVMAAVLCRWADRHRVVTAESLMRWLCD